ncbi:MAG: hypothetical protein M3O20_15030 [Acidobacteriota bacterium]|nr:hypothetical protein [Acidobacteriota bacterium]
MPRRVGLLIAFLLLLVPSAQFAWRNRDMPDFGRLHDDALMFVSAQGIAQGSGYRIGSLPENPYQTKYPPLFPAYLALVWHLNPHFPENVATATLFTWPWLAICLVLACWQYRQYGFSEPRALLLTAALGLSPYMALFGSMMLSEVFFTCFVLAALILARRTGNAAIMLAGVAVACAYLARTAGIALVISIPALLLWKRDWRRAALFLATSLPAVGGWAWWVREHIAHSKDMTLLYYVDYLGFRAANFGLDNLTVVVWKNVDQILYGMGSLVVPKIIDFLPVKILTQVIAVAMLAGVVRLIRKGIAIDYALFALLSLAILAVWHYPPNERFVLPLFPLLLAGLAAEMEHLGSVLRKALRHKDASQRAAAVVFAAGLAAFFAAAIGLQAYMTFSTLNQMAARERPKVAERRVAYRWMSKNLPADAQVLSNDDPLLYLSSGHRGNSILLLPRWWYADDRQSIVNAYRNAAAYCQARHLQYLYSTSDDLSRFTEGESIDQVLTAVRSDPHLHPVFTGSSGTLYQVSP